MNKPRSDAKLLNLPAAAQDKICDWLTEGVGAKGDTKYTTVREQIYKELNVRTSVGALVEFYRQVAAPRRLARAAAAANALNKQAREIGAQFEAPAMAALQQKAFEILAEQHTDPDELVAFMGLVLQAKKIDLKKQDLELQKNRFEFSAAKAALAHVRELKVISSDRSLNEEAKIEAVRARLFGKAPDK